MILNYNYPQQPKVEQNKQSQQKIHKIEDSLALRILFNTKQKEIQNLAGIFQLTYYVNEYQGYIETFEQQNPFDNSESASSCFIEQVNILLEDVKKKIKTQQYECNADEYQKIKKIIQKNSTYQKVFKQSAQLKFVNFDNSNQTQSFNSYTPDVLKKYVIDNQICIKVCQVNKPDQLNLKFFDYFLLNMSQNGLFTDSYGQELYDTNKIFKSKIKSIKNQIHQNNSLLIDALDFNQKNTSEDEQKQDIDYIFEESSKNGKNTPLTLCIQTAQEEKACLANLKLILDKIEKNSIQNHKGYFQFGLSLNNVCSNAYLQTIVDYLKDMNAKNKNNFFKLPTEFWIIVSDGNENRILNIMNSLTSKVDYDNEIFKPKNVTYNAYYLAGNAERKYFSNEFKGIIKKAQQKGLRSVPLIFSENDVTFRQNIKIGVNYAYPAYPRKNYKFPGGIPPYAAYSRPKPNIMKDDQEEIYKDIYRIDLVQMQMQGTLENSISPIVEDGNAYSFINTRTGKQTKFFGFLSKVIKTYLQLGVKQFNYELNLVGNSLLSTICELNFVEDTITVLGGRKVDGNSQPIQTFLAESYDQNQDKMQEEEPLFEDDKAFMEEEEVKKNSDEVNFKRPQLIVRGNDECTNLIGYIMQDLEQGKYILHEIKLNSSVPKDVSKFFHGLEILYKVWINIGQSSITIQGYRKTLKHLLPLIYKTILEIPLENNQQAPLFADLKMPTHWEKQDGNLRLVEISVHSEEGRKVVDQFQKSMVNIPVTKIERIQNLSLMKNYLFEKQKLTEKGNATEKLLFHGTRTCNPSIIYSSSEQGFDFRLGNQGGAYGKGTYFHDDATYSNAYKFTLPNGRSQMFLATVLVGKCTPQAPNQFVAPPFLNEAKGIRYDSVRCTAPVGHNQYIVYHNSKSYPLYLISY